MRTYENERNVHWADGDFCPYGFEQTPEAFIRHSVEILHLMRPAILDPFVGSGTTALAAAALGRRCLGFDISETYIEIPELRLRTAQKNKQYTLDETVDAAKPATIDAGLHSARQSA
jgi:DNA modification methylase